MYVSTQNSDICFLFVFDFLKSWSRHLKRENKIRKKTLCDSLFEEDMFAKIEYRFRN